MWLAPPVFDDPAVDAFGALFRYDPEVARLVLAAKNGARRDLLESIGSRLAELVLAVRDRPRPPPDLVTWVPASRHGAVRRGYDQGRVLARAVAARLDVRAGPSLIRRLGPAQGERDRLGRMVGPSLWAPGPIPARVVVVDDVMTTGTSLAEAASRLRASGAEEVVGAVIAVADCR